MGKMKMTFRLEEAKCESIIPSGSTICITGKSPENKPYVLINTTSTNLHFIADKDLERFAVNILKALKSKRLK